MAQKENQTFENPYFGYAETTTNTLKEFWGMQMKTSQNLFDHSMKAAQTWTEFAQTQVQEGAKVSQEMIKMGMATSEEAKKTWTHLTEKMTAGFPR